MPGTDCVALCAEYLDHWITRWVAHVKSIDPVHPVFVDGTSNQLIGGEISWRNNHPFATARLVDWFGGTYYPKSWGRNMTDAAWEFALYYETSRSAAQSRKTLLHHTARSLTLPARGAVMPDAGKLGALITKSRLAIILL